MIIGRCTQSFFKYCKSKLIYVDALRGEGKLAKGCLEILASLNLIKLLDLRGVR